MIVSQANNHILPLSAFASDQAHYHLKMSSQTLRAKGWCGLSHFSHRGHVTAHVRMHAAASQMAAGGHVTQALSIAASS